MYSALATSFLVLRGQYSVSTIEPSKNFAQKQQLGIILKGLRIDG